MSSRILRRAAVCAALAVAVTAAAAQPAAADPSFDPRIAGLHFVNRFTGQILVDIPRFGRVDLAKYPFGLCGGMSFAALDTFHAGGRAPADRAAPTPGTRLRTYLRERLLDTLLPDGARTVRRFVEWMARPIEDKDLFVGKFTGLKTLTRREFESKVHPALEAGRPVPLGLVKVTLSSPPWNNHTVLAIGDFRDADGRWVIDLYDPNFPDRVTYLHVERRTETYDRRGEREVPNGRWRGFFAIPYAYEKPYWIP